MSQYEFDAERFCLVRARAARAQRNFSDEQNFLRVAEEVKRLREEVATLKDAVRLLIITTQPVLGEDGHLWVTDHAIGALAALVGEE